MSYGDNLLTSQHADAMCPSATGEADGQAANAWAEAALRTGMTIVTVVAGTTCVFAVAAGGGLSALVQGLVFTGLGIAGVARIDVAMRVLRPRGRMVTLAGLFAAGGLLDFGLQSYFAEVAVAIVCLSALICRARWVLLCLVVSAAGFLGALAMHGRTLDWLIGDGRYVVAGQLVNLAANAAGGLLIVTLLHRFLADLPRLLDAVHAGGPSLTPQLAQAARGQPVALPPGADPRTLLAALTPAELDVVKRLAAGRLPKQVAHDLNIDKGAVDSRIKSARRKTGARTTVRLLWLYATCDGS